MMISQRLPRLWRPISESLLPQGSPARSFTDPVHPNTPPSASHPNGAGAALRQPHCLILRGEVADADGTFRGAVLGPDGEAPMLATTAERTVFAQSSQDECGAHESATAALSGACLASM